MYHLLTTKVRASASDAADPGFAAECLRLVAEGMHHTAADRSRHLVESPRLSESSDADPFGLVDLTFIADTEDD